MSVCWVTNSEPEGPQRSSSSWTEDGIKELLILLGTIMAFWLFRETETHTLSVREIFTNEMTQCWGFALKILVSEE